MRGSLVDGAALAVQAAVGGVVHLYLDGRLDDVLQVGGADEHAAVGALVHLEFEVEDEIAVRFLREDVAAALPCEDAVFPCPASRLEGAVRQVGRDQSRQPPPEVLFGCDEVGSAVRMAQDARNAAGTEPMAMMKSRFFMMCSFGG